MPAGLALPAVARVDQRALRALGPTHLYRVVDDSSALAAHLADVNRRAVQERADAAAPLRAAGRIFCARFHLHGYNIQC